MCGIVGFTHLRKRPDADLIGRALDLLRHRGPDDQGTYQSDSVSLGAARLKILDLEGGHQPIIARDRNTVIAFNGEIYNHGELRAELEALGYHFQSQADTETVLNAFLAWDTGCFERLRGMFAVAFWQESAKRLVLGRDRMGIKPLYIARRAGNLYFSSEVKSILIHSEIPRELSQPGLDCYLSLNYVPAPWTLIDGVEKLRPGHWMEWRNGSVRSESYWSLPSGTQRTWNAVEARTELDHLLQQSVSEHLLSDVPLGVWLSGGLDSTTILHYARQASSQRLKTFSISFKGRSFDESSAIRQTVRHYSTEHYELDLNPTSDLESAIDEFAYYSDEPNADAGALPVWFLSQLTKGAATVALSGEGADELFAGYLTYRADRLARFVRPLRGWPLSLLRKTFSYWPVSDEKIGFEYKAKRFLEGCSMPPELAHVFWNGTFSDEEKRRLLAAPDSSAFEDFLGARCQTAGLSHHLWFDQHYYLPDNILTKVDRISMAHSVEVRPPFLDHRIVEFAASLPDSLKLAGSRSKVVLRDVMKDRLSMLPLRKAKIGFDIPAHEWLRGPLRGLLTETLEEGCQEYHELFHATEIRQVLDEHLSRRKNLGYHLWGLMILFRWMKKWGVQASWSQKPEEMLVRSASTST